MRNLKNVTKIARDMIYEIGAVSETPPDGWRRMVSQKLEEMGVDVKKVNLYAIRTKELVKNCENNVNLDQDYKKILLEVSALARRVGGTERLVEYARLIENLKV